ncbi:DMT family transporter [Sphingomonas psychrotolerans]|uniref:DMT family transporter n=1 Tax=Sphingomonas psychrotolerans TaxID=1327635 RepID=A0ABU3N834_9SPHN|nr:DMT family transporter [Sphingomonas psychrotolerans]MDT8760678.1 DMT family transporter [Sphingomonas psychrotolerans]
MQDARSPRKTLLPKSHAAMALVALVVANVALAFGPLFVRVSDVGPVAAGFWRIALATPVLLLASVATGDRPFTASRGLWGVLALAGLAFAADLASWHIGIGYTTLANSTLFGNSATLIFPIYGFVAARRWPTKVQGLALLFAAVGAGLLMGRSASLSREHLIGDLFCLLAGALYAVYFVLMARARERLAPIPALALSSLASVPPLLLLALGLGEQIWPGNWWPLLALAVVSQLIGQGCMIYALGHLTPLVVGIGLLIQPVVAAALGWIVFDEKLATGDAVGAVLVAVALVLVRGSNKPERLAPGAGEPKSL